MHAVHIVKSIHSSIQDLYGLNVLIPMFLTFGSACSHALSFVFFKKKYEIILNK